MLTVQSLRSEWMLKKNWLSSLPFPDSATLACTLFLPSRSRCATPASSPFSLSFIKASWFFCLLATSLLQSHGCTVASCELSLLNYGSVTNSEFLWQWTVYGLLKKGQWGENSYLNQKQTQALREQAVEKSVIFSDDLFKRFHRTIVLF